MGGGERGDERTEEDLEPDAEGEEPPDLRGPGGGLLLLVLGMPKGGEDAISDGPRRVFVFLDRDKSSIYASINGRRV